MAPAPTKSSFLPMVSALLSEIVSSARDLGEARQAAEEVSADTAGDDEVVAVDVARVGAEQERDDIRHVFGRRHPPEPDHRVALGCDPRVGVYLAGPAPVHHARPDRA